MATYKTAIDNKVVVRRGSVQKVRGVILRVRIVCVWAFFITSFAINTRVRGRSYNTGLFLVQSIQLSQTNQHNNYLLQGDGCKRSMIR